MVRTSRRACMVVLAVFLAGCGDPGQEPKDDATDPEDNGTAPPQGPTYQPGAWEEVPCPDAVDADRASLPDLLVSLQNRTVILHHDGTGYVETTRAMSSYRSLTVLDGSFYGIARVGTDDAWTYEYPPGEEALVRLDVDLKETSRKVFPDVGVVHAAEGTLWMGSRWNLTAYTPDLQEISRLFLNVNSTFEKQIDRLHVHDGTAYVVDDIASPYIVFRVDVSDPQHMEVIHRFEFWATGGTHIHMLDAAGTWYVDAGTGGHGSGHQTLHLYAADGTESETTLYTSEGHVYPASTITGHHVEDATFQLPAWALIEMENEKMALAWIDIAGGIPKFACATTLPDVPEGYGWPLDRSVRRSDDLVVVSYEQTVEVFDGRGRPVSLEKVQLDQTIKDLVILDA